MQQRVALARLHTSGAAAALRQRLRVRQQRRLQRAARGERRQQAAARRLRDIVHAAAVAAARQTRRAHCRWPDAQRRHRTRRRSARLQCGRRRRRHAAVGSAAAQRHHVARQRRHLPNQLGRLGRLGGVAVARRVGTDAEALVEQARRAGAQARRLPQRQCWRGLRLDVLQHPGMLQQVVHTWALARVLRQRCREEGPRVGRQVRRDRWVVRQDRVVRLARRVTRKRRAADEQLKREDADRPDIHCGAILEVGEVLVLLWARLIRAQQHLGCHVIQRARTRDWALLTPIYCQTKVRQLQRAIPTDEQVLGLDVPVQDAQRVQLVQRQQKRVQEL
mmetsp:Transcript_15548/g.32363  ORF Transcript_15548/g.32363 Transcript_15548/m.32363 type:complete len:334 (-) Transcript_15548:599-1600(-)